VSLAELLPAIRALPRAERVQLLHLLIDEVAEAPAAPEPLDAFTEEMRKLFPPGYVAHVWFPGPNPEAAAAAIQGLKEFEATRE
jgi:hypothetical protein